MFGIAADSDVAARLARGDDWFSMSHGGYVFVTRAQFGSTDSPGVRSDVAADHWVAAAFGSLPAAIGRPVLDQGLGRGELVLWDPSTSIITYVVTLNVSLDDLYRIGEGLAP
jgi:hypothetical protein